MVGVNATGQVREFQLRTRFRFQLRTLKGKLLIVPTEILLQRDISFNESAVLAKETEEQLLYRDMLQEMRLALRAHRVPGMNDDDVPSCPQVLRLASEHGAKTTAFRGQIGRLDPGMQFDAVAIDYQAATYPFQDDDIPPDDTLLS